jgi:translocation and assembly module TamB
MSEGAHPWRKAFIVAAMLGAFLIAVFAAVAIWLQSQAGGRWIAAALANQIKSATAMTATIEAAQFRFPLTLRIERLQLHQNGERWLAASGLFAEVAITPLLAGDVRVRDLRADLIQIDRIPAADDSSTEPDAPAVPALPFSVDAFRVAQLQLAETLLGEAAAFRLEGAIDGGRRPRFALQADRTDAGRGSLRLNATLAETVSAELQLEDPQGIVARLLNAPGGAQPLTMTAQASGDRAAWRGELRAELGAQTLRAALEGGDADAERQNWSLSAEAALAEFAPTPLKDRVGSNFVATASGSFDAQNLVIADFRIVPTALESAALTGSAVVDRASLNVAADAVLTIENPQAIGLPMFARLRIAVEDFRRLAQSSPPPFDVRVEAALAADAPPAVRAFVGEQALVNARLQWEKSGIAISSFALMAAGADLVGRGRYGFDGTIDVAAQTSRWDAASTGRAFGLEIEGNPALHVNAAGTLNDLTSTLRIEAPQMTLAGTPVHDGRADIVIADALTSPTSTAKIVARVREVPIAASLKTAREGDAWTARDIRLTAPGVSLTGEALSVRAGLIEGALNLSAETLTPAARAFGIDVSGEAVGAVSLRARGEKQALRGDLRTRNLRVERWAASDRLTLDVSLGDARAWDDGAFSIDAQGGKLFEEAMRSVMLSGKIEAGRVVFDLAATSLQEGAADMQAAGVFALRDPLRLDVNRLEGAIARQRIALAQPLIVARAREGWTASAPHFTLGSGTGALRLALRGQTIDGEVELEDAVLPLRWLYPSLPRVAQTDLSLQIAGPIENPTGAVDAFLTIADIDGWNATLRAQASLRDRTVRLTSRLAALQSTFDLTGTVRLPAGLQVASFQSIDSVIALRAEGVGDLSALSDFLPLGEDRLAGAFRLDAAIAGTLDRPLIDGRLSIDNGSYENFLSGAVFADLLATIAFTGDGLSIERFTATDGAAGLFTARGRFSWRDSGQPALDARFDRFRLVRRDDVFARVSGEVGLQPFGDAPILRGALRIDEAQISIADAEFASVRTIDVIEDPAQRPSQSNPETDRAKAALVLDVAARSAGPIFVRGRGLDSEWSGRLQVTGTSAAPQLTGRFEVERGSFTLFGRRLTLESGYLAMTGGGPRDAFISVNSRTDSDGTTLEAALSGPVTDPRLNLSSSPPLPSEEVLARLLFNRGRANLGAFEAIQLADAARSIAGIGGSAGLVERLRNVFGLASLDIGTDEEGNAEVRAGAYVGRGVYLGVERNTGSGESEATVEIDVTRNLSVETGIGTGNQRSIGLNWRRDY